MVCGGRGDGWWFVVVEKGRGIVGWNGFVGVVVLFCGSGLAESWCEMVFLLE